MNSWSSALNLEIELNDFRNARWGMTKQEVKNSEPTSPSSEGYTHISYKDMVLGLDSVVGFHFMDNALVEAGYAFREKYDEDGQYIKQYGILKEHFSSIFGQPIMDEDINTLSSSCSVVKEEPPLESLMLITEWFTERTIIRMILMGNAGSCEFGVLHISRGHVQAIENTKRQIRWGTN